MITTQLNGRTGNNMFQIAAALAVAKRNNVEAFYIGDGSHIQGFKLKGIKREIKKLISYLKKENLILMNLFILWETGLI